MTINITIDGGEVTINPGTATVLSLPADFGPAINDIGALQESVDTANAAIQASVDSATDDLQDDIDALDARLLAQEGADAGNPNTIEEVALATTGNIVLSGAQSVDGEAVTDGMRIAVWKQSLASENGFYTASTTGPWARSADTNTAATLSFATAYVLGGVDNTGLTLRALSTSDITLETDDVPFAVQGDASAATAAIDVLIDDISSTVSRNSGLLTGLYGAAPVTDYHVRTDGDNSADGLTYETAWATITYAVHRSAEIGGDKSILVHAGNYHDEGETNDRWNFNGNTITVYAGGIVNIRVSESTNFNGHAWLLNGGDDPLTAGGVVFEGGVGHRLFTFDMERLGDDSLNTNKSFIGGNNKYQNLVFNDCNITAGGQPVRFLGGSGLIGSLTFRRCEITDIDHYIAFVKGGEYKIHSCYLRGITNSKICFGNMDLLEILHSTFDGTEVSRNSSEIYGTIRIKNSSFIAKQTISPLTPSPYANFTNGAVTTADIEGNNYARKEFNSPAIASDYTGADINNPDYYDQSWRLPVTYDAYGRPTGGGWLIGRGISGIGITHDIDGVAYESAPSIGAHAARDEIGKIVIPKANSVAMVGDSFIHAGSDKNSMSHVTEASLPEMDFAKMPNSGFVSNDVMYFNHVSIFGGIWSAISLMAMETVIKNRCYAIALLGGVNDLNGGLDRDVLAGAIKQTLDRIADLGVKPIYMGTQLRSTVLGAENTVDSRYVEDDVAAHCTAQGYTCVKTSELVMLEPNWQTALFSTDGLHPNAAGDAWYAGHYKTALRTALTEV